MNVQKKWNSMEHTIVRNDNVFGLVGDSHRYKTNKGEISLLYPCRLTNNMYEIYCVKGKLIDDIERFYTLNEAEERIKNLLNK